MSEFSKRISREGKSPNTLKRYATCTVALLASSAALAACGLSPEQPPESPSPQQRPSLEQFINTGIPPVPESRIKAMRDASLRLSGKKKNCSASTVNGYVITAGHCVDTEHRGSIQLFNAQNKKVGTLLDWHYYLEEGHDVAVGKPEWTAPHPSLQLDYLSTEPLKPGEPFANVSYPGDIERPITATMFYSSSRQQGSEHDFFPSPATPPATMNKLCEPGSSGSLVMNAGNTVGVLTEKVDNQEYIATYEPVNLQNTSVNRICGVDIIDTSSFNALTKGL